MTQRVKVPQDKGEILISRGGDEAVRLSVAGGFADVPDELVDAVLRGIPGSEVAPAGNPGAKEAQK